MGNLLDKTLNNKQGPDSPSKSYTKNNSSLLSKRLNGNDVKSANSPIDNIPELITAPIKISNSIKHKKPKIDKAIKVPEEPQNDIFNEELFEKEYDAICAKKAQSKIKRDKKNVVYKKITQCILILLCFYLLFLIYGMFITQYEYDISGNVKPSILSIEEIDDYENYQKILGFYLSERALYEKTLILDYRLSVNDEDLVILGTEYEALLDSVEEITVQLNAVTVPTAYNQLVSMMTTWVKTDIAVYLQNVSAAIIQNNSEKADYAIINRQTVYDDFNIITQTLVSLGENIKNIDLTNIKNWSTTGYIKETIGKVD